MTFLELGYINAAIARSQAVLRNAEGCNNRPDLQEVGDFKKGGPNMMNRFENCNSLIEIFQVIFGEEMVDFSSLTKEEKKTLLEVYKDCNGPNAHMMAELTLSNYNTIIKNVFEIAKSLKEMADNMSMETMENENKMEEEENMENMDINKETNKGVTEFVAALDNFLRGASTAVKSTAIQVGSAHNEFKVNSDAAITTLKTSFGVVLEKLDWLLGCTTLKNQLYNIVYVKTENTNSKRGFLAAAAECRHAVNAWIKNILDYDPDQVELKQVAALRYMMGEDESGKKIEGRRCVFAAFVNSIIWICKKAINLVKKKFGKDAATNIFGSVGAAIASVFGIAAGIITSVLRLAINFVVFVGSYVLSATLNAITWVIEKIEGWKEKAAQKFTTKDKELDEKLNEELAKEEAEAEKEIESEDEE